jgi:hypothetical protein
VANPRSPAADSAGSVSLAPPQCERKGKLTKRSTRQRPGDDEARAEGRPKGPTGRHRAGDGEHARATVSLTGQPHKSAPLN